jgi:hypothetical protein
MPAQTDREQKCNREREARASHDQRQLNRVEMVQHDGHGRNRYRPEHRAARPQQNPPAS